MTRIAVLATVLAACGDNKVPVGLPLLHARDLTIVAHSDDDLVYMQPDQLERVRRDGATIAYFTDGSARAHARHSGIMQAYSAATGHDGWYCGWIELAGHNVEHCRLEDARLSLVFFGYPEGDHDGETPTSIARLWDGRLPIAITIGDLTTKYTRDDVIATLAELVELTQPRTVRTMDLAGVHRDHADHAVIGAAALLAIAATEVTPELISYRGDETEADPETLIDPLFARSSDLLGIYDGCAEGTVACGEPAPITDEHAVALRRRYAVSLRHGGGELREPSGCVAANADGSLQIGSCPSAEPWLLGDDGLLRVGSRCIETLLFNGELIASDRCTVDPGHRFFLDDEGHLWTGAPPPLAPGGALLCVAVIGGRPHATQCGSSLSPAWELSPTPTSTARPALPLDDRAVRLADIDGDHLADLCVVAAGKLRCNPGDGTGGFGAQQVVTSLAIEPESLVIGDVDGDGVPDACGRDGAGLLCATASAGFVAERWSPAFARSGPPTANDRSLAAVDSDNNGSAEICGLAFDGIACAQHDLLSLPPVKSPWPPQSAAVWPGDLDGDRHADWCAVSNGTAFCGLDALAPITSDGVPWAFSLNGVTTTAPADTATGALADIDGDGRADLCTARMIDTAFRIACARSQGFGFGPYAVIGTLATTTQPIGLWVADVDGDGIADACADDGATIECALTPR